MTSQRVSIYMLDVHGWVIPVARQIQMQNFKAFSAITIKPPECNSVEYTVTLPRGKAEMKAATRIITWITTNDINNPKRLNPDNLDIEEFDDLVNVYAAAGAMQIKRQFRGDELHNTIYEYIKSSPLSYDEFAMIFDFLRFDFGLVKTAMHQVIFGKIKGGLKCPPELNKIKRFCENHSVWENMMVIEAQILEKMSKPKKKETLSVEEATRI